MVRLNIYLTLFRADSQNQTNAITSSDARDNSNGTVIILCGRMQFGKSRMRF